MERREFLAALGTAAAVSSASQVFLLRLAAGAFRRSMSLSHVALEAKPGKRRGGRRVFAPGQGIGRGRTCDDCLVRRSSRTLNLRHFRRFSR